MRSRRPRARWRRVRAAATVPFAVLLVGALGASAYALERDAQYELGRQLFMQADLPACALCHTLKDAGAEGAIGPILDELKPDAQRVATALRNGIGQMPSYEARLTEAQIQALAQYVSKAAAGSQ